MYLYALFQSFRRLKALFTLSVKIHPFTHIHTLMTGATTQGINLLIRRKLTIQTHPYTVGTAIRSTVGLSILPKDTWTFGLEEPGIKPPIFNGIFQISICTYLQNDLGYGCRGISTSEINFSHLCSRNVKMIKENDALCPEITEEKVDYLKEENPASTRKQNPRPLVLWILSTWTSSASESIFASHSRDKLSLTSITSPYRGLCLFIFLKILFTLYAVHFYCISV